LTTNVEVVRRIQDSISRGQIIEAMSHLARDIRWEVNTMNREAAPWFKQYRGRSGVVEFFEALSQVEMRDFAVKAVVGGGDLVTVWLHLEFASPSGRSVDMDEVQIWTFADGKVQSVDLFPDTLAIANAFA
jgi:ketosteroid isomerase-like protein